MYMRQLSIRGRFRLGDVIVLVILGFCLVFVLRILGKGTRTADKTICMRNMQQLAMALSMYAADWNDRLPQADRWVAVLGPSPKTSALLHCPNDPSHAACSYGMNPQLGGKELASILNPKDVVLLYETAHPGASPHGDPSDVASPPRHNGSNNYAFADGTVRLLKQPPTFTPVIANSTPKSKP
jgi:prepilin-type processing-associated H-X9-DG protein